MREDVARDRATDIFARVGMTADPGGFAGRNHQWVVGKAGDRADGISEMVALDVHIEDRIVPNSRSLIDRNDVGVSDQSAADGGAG